MSTATAQQFVTDDSGNRVGVILDMVSYSALVEAAEELEAIRAYDDAKAAGDEMVPFEQAVREIEL